MSTPTEIPANQALLFDSGSQDLYKALEEVLNFSAKGYTKQVVFSTDQLLFGTYCFEPGQVNSLHKHPTSSELLYFLRGEGLVVIQMPSGEKTLSVKSGSFVNIPEDTFHEIRNTGSDPMVVILVQSPLPCISQRMVHSA
ncbi:MAG: cupin domain-containing protein [Cyanobacteriota bacterium]|nr:cupin domain-containing protein [Cyanobacteriota bacterium]